MGWIQKIVSLTWLASKKTARVTANSAASAKRYVSAHEGDIAAATSKFVAVVGKSTTIIGGVVEGAADIASSKAKSAVDSSDTRLGKFAGQSASVLARGLALSGRGVAMGGGVVDQASGMFGAAVGSGIAGGTALASEAIDSVAVSPADIEAMRAKLRVYGEAILARSRARENRLRLGIMHRRRGEVFDALVIGGVSVAEIVRAKTHVPAEIQSAFATAYPDLASRESFAAVVERLSPEQIPGLVAGVKGKMFEQALVEQLNDDLPDGFLAELASSPTQVGWDIRVLDGDGQPVELLQAKATESVDYVRDALTRYPDIDVISTTEVYAQMAALSIAEQVRDSGISEAALEASINAASNAISSGVDFSDVLPSGIGLGFIALSTLLDRSMPMEERARMFGERSGRAGVSSLAGKALIVATQTWWVGLIGGVGAHWLAAKGRAKREQYDALRGLLTTLEQNNRRAVLLTHQPN